MLTVHFPSQLQHSKVPMQAEVGARSSVRDTDHTASDVIETGPDV